MVIWVCSSAAPFQPVEFSSEEWHGGSPVSGGWSASAKAYFGNRQCVPEFDFVLLQQVSEGNLNYNKRSCVADCWFHRVGWTACLRASRSDFRNSSLSIWNALRYCVSLSLEMSRCGESHRHASEPVGAGLLRPIPIQTHRAESFVSGTASAVLLLSSISQRLLNSINNLLRNSDRLIWFLCVDQIFGCVDWGLGAALLYFVDVVLATPAK